MMNMNNEVPYVCIHEDKFQDHEAKIERLETRADYKDEKINQIIQDNQMMNQKLDKITESIHQLQLNSARDDFNIDNRVTGLETTVRTLKYVVGLILSVITVAISVLVFILTYVR